MANWSKEYLEFQIQMATHLRDHERDNKWVVRFYETCETVEDMAILWNVWMHKINYYHYRHHNCNWFKFDRMLCEVPEGE